MGYGPCSPSPLFQAGLSARPHNDIRPPACQPNEVGPAAAYATETGPDLARIVQPQRTWSYSMKMLEGLGVPRVLPGPVFSANFTPIGPACGSGSPTRNPTPDVGRGPSGTRTLTPAPVSDPTVISAPAVVPARTPPPEQASTPVPTPAAESWPAAVSAGLPTTVIDADRDNGTS